jgi:hypothetical protein
MSAPNLRRALTGFALCAFASSCEAAGQSPKAAPETIETSQSELTTPGVARQRWRAANEQAEAIAGSLIIAPSDREAGAVSLAFAHGVTLWARPAMLPVEDADVRKLVRDTREWIGAPDDTFPVFYEVMEERVALTAPQGGLCGGMRTRVIAIAEFLDQSGNKGAEQWALHIVAFHTPSGDPLAPVKFLSIQSATAGLGGSPRRRVDPANLRDCFAFDYVQPQAD